MNRHFKYTLLNQVWKLLSGPVLLFFVPIYLSPIDQGLWFSIISLGALVILVDLGFSSIVALFTAHEFAFLKLNSDSLIVGDPVYLDKLASLFIFCLKQIKKVCLFIFPIILIVNFIILSSKSNYEIWVFPWAIYNCAAVITFINNILLAFVEGCDQVSFSQKIRLQSSIINIVFTILLLISHVNLYALGIGTFFSAIIMSTLIARKFGKTLYILSTNSASYNWASELYRLLIKYAGSYLSGYCIFSIFTPLALTNYDTISAGRVGLSISLCMAFLAVANVWIMIVTPKINMLIASDANIESRSIFRKALFLSTITFVGEVIVFFFFYFTLKDKVLLFGRLVSISSFLILVGGWFCQVFINSFAIYIRAHKEEPLVTSSVLAAIYILASTWASVKYLSFDYIFLGFFTAYLWWLPWVYFIYRRYTK